jgi:hypothetical protein
MEDGPRYRTIAVHPRYVDEDLRQNLRPGDRVVSVFPSHIGPHGSEHPLMLKALLELRHPSWAKEGVGWLPGEEDR